MLSRKRVGMARDRLLGKRFPGVRKNYLQGQKDAQYGYGSGIDPGLPGEGRLLLRPPQSCTDLGLELRRRLIAGYVSGKETSEFPAFLELGPADWAICQMLFHFQPSR